MEKPVIAVIGATGAQGGGLVRAILEDPGHRFAARAITRDPDAVKAKELQRLGAEVVAADLGDPQSIERAFRGAHAAFCVTFFWAHMSPEREIEEARVMAAAARATGLKHVIWSTLEDTRRLVPLADTRMPTLQGKYKVPHFDAKGEANHLFTDLGVPTTFLLTSFYWDNLIHFGMGPRKGDDGRLVFALPMGHKKLPGIAAEDIGRCAFGIFQQGSGFTGQTVGIAGEMLTGQQMADELGRALGQPVVYQAVPFDVYRGLGFPGADDLGNMFQYKHDFDQAFCGARNVERSRALNPKLQSFAQWLAANKDRIPLG